MRPSLALYILFLLEGSVVGSVLICVFNHIISDDNAHTSHHTSILWYVSRVSKRKPDQTRKHGDGTECPCFELSAPRFCMRFEKGRGVRRKPLQHTRCSRGAARPRICLKVMIRAPQLSCSLTLAHSEIARTVHTAHDGITEPC